MPVVSWNKHQDIFTCRDIYSYAPAGHCSKHSSVVCCALANKLARIAWAITTRQTVFVR
ncbi:TPA: hypothetical protein G8O14_005122 [Salmonella enterica]|nr:hypothetical protein [Salmonella enterica subsp. enterica serovar Panama]HAF4711106.1 hypothetical protein [Salmonella enterica]HAF4899199.1 hypothetical protein [Salmonella enterica]